MAIYFTADPHYFHDPIIEACNRPYRNSHIMGKDMIRKYNERVSQNDTCYILGDLTLVKDKEPIRRLLDKLNGHKILILGNHDYLNPFTYVDIGFISVHTSLEISTHVGDFVLVHDPAISQIDRNRTFLCGHIHDLFKMQKNCINVGVDVWGFYPVSLSEIIVFIQQIKSEGKHWRQQNDQRS